MKSFTKTLVRLAGAGGLGAAIVTIGLQILPEGFPPGPQRGRDEQAMIDLPPALPAPARRHFEQAFGACLPQVSTAVVRGRGWTYVGAIRFPMRFRAAYVAGLHFHRQEELTWFGRPVVQVEERYINGQGQVRRGGRVQSGPNISQAANTRLWAEMIFLPATLAAHPRLRWEALDDERARVWVPWRNSQEPFTFHFDQQSGQPVALTTVRYRHADQQMAPWRVDFSGWQNFPSGAYPLRLRFAWEDRPRPEAEWLVDAVEQQADVSDRLLVLGNRTQP